MNTRLEGNITRFFGLFDSRDWASFKSLPVPVQQDMRALLILDSITKSSIVKQFDGRSGHGAMDAYVRGMKGNVLLIGELQICLLSTAIGTVLDGVSWNSLAAERAIDCLGMLAMCEFRNDDKLEGDVDLHQSGYSSDPDEARCQFMVLFAQTLKLDVEDAGRLCEESFVGTWLQLRSTLLKVGPLGNLWVDLAR